MGGAVVVAFIATAVSAALGDPNFAYLHRLAAYAIYYGVPALLGLALLAAIARKLRGQLWVSIFAMLALSSFVSLVALDGANENWPIAVPYVVAFFSYSGWLVGSFRHRASHP
jgi:hypothetical protein